MYPAYTWTDSNPHHANAKEMIPSNMKMDLSSPRPRYQPWHYGGNYPYPVPQQYHGCCNHSCYGGGPYGFWPPYPHYPPPPPPTAFHPHGLYPPFPGAYPAYSVPPQHHSVEQPRYEYDKDNHALHHCCGCNHNKWDDEKGLKIKEEPQVENKNSSEPLVPLLLKDHPEYPIMWVPRGYVSNNESKANEKERNSHDFEPSKQGGNGEIMWVPRGYNRNSEPKVAKEKERNSHDFEPSKQGGNGEIMWLPRGYISNSEPKVKEKNSCDLEPSKPGGNGEMAQDEQGAGGNRFPFKIFWLPSKNDEVGKDTNERNLDQEANKGLSDEKTMKKNEGFGSEGERETRKHAVVAPVKQASTNKEEIGSKHPVQKVVPVKQVSTNKEETSGKHAVQKVIPVKQGSTNEEKNNLKGSEIIVNSDSVEKTENGGKASPKTPKLPPVCLRVDPLPRKKKSSRSPSPSEKGRSAESRVNSPKSSQQQAPVFKKSEEEQDEGHIKTVDPANKVEQDNFSGHGDVLRGKGDEAEKKEVKENKILSQHEAAVIIQSVYRGFEVRKSQPLKKLRQINEVRKQVFELRNRIQNLESSSPALHIDGKTKLIIGETIMSLLLKLDTIQGLHPFVREVRKSVAKELVGLQEKLDSLTSAKSEASGEGAMSSPQQAMPSKDDAIQETSDQAQALAHTGLCENHDNTATESQHDDDAEVCDTPNLEQESEKSTEDDAPNLEQESKKSTEDDAIADKSHQVPTESDTFICENQEVKGAESEESGDLQLGLHIQLCDNQGVEAIESQEGCNTIAELQMGMDKEKLDQAPTERDEALGLCENHEVQSTESQEGSNTIDELQLEMHKEKLDQAPTQHDEALGPCENHEVESTESQEGCNTVGEAQLSLDKEKFDKASTESDEALETCENHEVATTDSQGACNAIGEPQLESHKEELDQAPTEDLGLCENHEAEATVSQEGCNTITELQLESHKENLDQAPTEALGSCENQEVESTESQESQEGCNTIGEPQMESHKEKLGQAPTECDDTDKALGLSDNHEVKTMDSVDNGGVEAHDMKLEHNSSELNNNQLQMLVETDVHADDAVQDLVQVTNVETMVHDSEARQRHEVETTESCNEKGTEACDSNLESRDTCGSMRIRR